jgi:hypothetical protein
MTEKKTNVMMTTKQKALLSHVQDLDRKIGNTQFNMDQLRMGRDAVAQHLVNALENPEPEEEAA